ncbi:MAG: hypothetical protein ACLQVK_02820 [Acidimicrobiales bacterium]
MNGRTWGPPGPGTGGTHVGTGLVPPGPGTALALRVALAVMTGPAVLGALALTGPPAVAAARRPAEIGNKVLVKTANVHKYGKVLVDQKGLALYYNADDKPSHWACTGACLVVWPPLTVPPGETLAQLSSGIRGVGTVPGVTGRQATWDGKPLYTFSHDSPGTVKGEGIGHVWYVVQMSRPVAADPSWP